MAKFQHIRTSKFPIVEGEAEEAINPGTFGRSFAEFVQAKLQSAGYEAPAVIAEDWGWWVDVVLPSKAIGMTCYREHDNDGPCQFVCSTSLEGTRVWSWSKFRFLDLKDEIDVLLSVLRNAFEADPEIEFIGETEVMPF